SRGFKAGGINLDRAGTILTATGVNTDFASTPGVDEGTANFLDPRFKAELVDAYEVGIKQSFWAQKFNYNATFFLMQIDDFQLNTFTGFNFVPENVDAATTMGVEFELQTRPIEGLNIRSGVTWAQTDYDDGITDLTNILTNDRGLRFPDTTGVALPVNDDLPEISNLAGRQLTNAPLWVVTSSITYRKPIPNTNLEAWAHTDFRIDSGYNTGSDLDPVKEQDGYTVVNAQIGVGDLDGVWELSLWARNLFDKNYQQIAFDLPLQSNDGWGTFLADPRTYGATLRARF
ncbi:MAG: TonB-dependent receptor domain-containing protein, partial [Alphaproteobacteria bacterium]